MMTGVYIIQDTLDKKEKTTKKVYGLVVKEKEETHKAVSRTITKSLITLKKKPRSISLTVL